MKRTEYREGYEFSFVAYAGPETGESAPLSSSCTARESGATVRKNWSLWIRTGFPSI